MFHSFSTFAIVVLGGWVPMPRPAAPAAPAPPRAGVCCAPRGLAAAATPAARAVPMKSRRFMPITPPHSLLTDPTRYPHPTGCSELVRHPHLKNPRQDDATRNEVARADAGALRGH